MSTDDVAAQATAPVEEGANHDFQEVQAPAVHHEAHKGGSSALAAGPIEGLSAAKVDPSVEEADLRPLVLFDLNGVLVSEKQDGEMGGRARTWTVRPDISLILLLLPRYRLGIFSSAMRHNVETALHHVHLAVNRGRKGIDVEQWEGTVAEARSKKKRKVPPGVGGPRDLFQVILSRQECAPDEAWESRPGGKPWDTIKPLAGNGLPAASGHVLLVDNEARKSATGEEDCCCVIPTWDNSADLGAAGFATLVRELLALAATPSNSLDFRVHSARITASIAAADAGAAAVVKDANELDLGVNSDQNEEGAAANTHAKPPAGQTGREEKPAQPRPAGQGWAADAALAAAAAQREQEALEPTAKRRRVVATGDVTAGVPGEVVLHGSGYMLLPGELDTQDAAFDGGDEDRSGDEEVGSEGLSDEELFEASVSTSGVSEDDGSVDEGLEVAWEEGEDEEDDGSGSDKGGPLDGLAEGRGGQEEMEEENVAADRALPAHKRGRQLPGAQPLYQGPHARPGSPAHAPSRLSALHYEVEAFAAAAAPSEAHLAALDATLKAIQSVAVGLWPAMQVQTSLFGSQAAGLALPGSDLDVVILGVLNDCHSPDDLARQRVQATMELQRLAKALRRAKLVVGSKRTLQIIPAKVPIIKACLMAGPMHAPLEVDISLGVASGPGAAALMRASCSAAPALRPLVLTMKALLKEAGLNEVFTGGLSSYSVFNLVLCHLQCEGAGPAWRDVTRLAQLPSSTVTDGRQRRSPWPQQQGGTGPSSRGVGTGAQGLERDVVTYLRTLNHASASTSTPGLPAARGNAGSTGPACRRQSWAGVDLGDMLLSLLYRYGYALDWRYEAVSVLRGGVISKPAGWMAAAPGGLGAACWPLCVEDPQVSGRNVAHASFNSPCLRLLARAALAKLVSRSPRDDPLNTLPNTGMWRQALSQSGEGRSAGRLPVRHRLMNVSQMVARVSQATARVLQTVSRKERLGKAGRRNTRLGWVPDLLMWPGAPGPASGQPPAAAPVAEDTRHDSMRQVHSAHGGPGAVDGHDSDEDAAKWAAVQADGASMSHEVTVAAAATSLGASCMPAFHLVLLGGLFDVHAALNAARKQPPPRTAVDDMGDDEDACGPTPQHSGGRRAKAQSGGKQHAKQLHTGASVALSPEQRDSLRKAGFTKAQVAAGERKGLTKKQAAILRKMKVTNKAQIARMRRSSILPGTPEAGPAQADQGQQQGKSRDRQRGLGAAWEDRQDQAVSLGRGGSRKRGLSRSQTRAAKRVKQADVQASVGAGSQRHSGRGRGNPSSRAPSRGRAGRGGPGEKTRGQHGGAGRGERRGREKARGGWVGV